MTEEFRTAEAIFYRAIEQDDGSREAFLNEACGDNHELRQEVDKLVADHGRAGDFLEKPAAHVPTIDHSPIAERPGTVIGRYKLMEEIGEGGFGLVFVAEQQKPLRRKVALKIIKPGMDTKEVIARFEAERQALALMDHPNVASVLDAGTTDSGRPYFVMELVKGFPLVQYCDQQELTVRERLELFISVCKAVQHAHVKGIIHRDLKPSNILIAPHDGVPVVKVIDFGVAKAIGQQLTDKTIYTGLAQMLGTPLYMSPEQAEINALDVDTRSDIYTLGVLLYELLTGTTPFNRQRFATAAYNEIRRIICEEEPPKPSTRLSSLGEQLPAISSKRTQEASKLLALVKGDLDWITLKAMEKDRTRRYETANGLASDVQRYLNDEPVAARPPSALYRFRKMARRNKAAVIATTVVLGSLIGGLVLSTWGWAEAEVARAETELARQEAEDEAARKRRLLYIADMGLAREAWESGELRRLEALLHRHVPRGNEEDLRGFEWFYLWRLWKRESFFTRSLLPNPNSYSALELAVSADGSRLAVAHPRGKSAVTLLDMESEETLGSFGIAGPAWRHTCVAMSSNGETLAYTDGGAKTLLVRSLETGKDGSLKSGQAKSVPLGEVAVRAAAFSPDRKILAIGCEDSTVRLWNLSEWKQTAKLEGHKGPVRALAFSPHESRIVSVSVDATVLAWSLETKQVVWQGTGSSAPVLDVAYSPNGALVATACADRTVTIWDAADGTRLRTLIGGRDEIRGVAFSHDGKLLAAGSRDFQVRVWNVPEFTEREVISGYNDLWGLVFLPDGKLVFGAEPGGRIAVRPINAAEHSDILPCRRRTPVRCMAFSPDGSILAALGGGEPHQIRLWSLTRDHAKEIEPLQLDCTAGAMAVSCDGLLAVGDKESASVYLFDLASRQSKGSLKVPRSQTAISRSIAFSPSGKRLAVGYEDGAAVIWDVEAQRVLFDHATHGQAVSAVCFYGEETIFTGGLDCGAKIWDVAGGKLTKDLGTQSDWVVAAGSSLDGGLIAAGIWSDEPTIKLWKGDSFTDFATLRGHFDAVFGVAIIRDGRTLVSDGCDRTVRIWDLSTREQRFAIDGGTSIFQSLAVSPDERTLAAGARDGTIRLYRAASPDEVQAERGWWKLPEGEPTR